MKGQSTPNDINLLRLLSRGILLLQGRSYETFELQHIVSFFTLGDGVDSRLLTGKIWAWGFTVSLKSDDN